MIVEDEMKRYRIRKLTPIEAFKLMGLKEEDCRKASAVGVSNSQLYKCAGNGIITNCVELLFEHLYKAQYEPQFKCFDEYWDENFTEAVTV